MELCKLVAEQSAKAVSMELGAWIFKNSLPAFVEPKHDGRRVWVVKNGDDIVMATKHTSVYTKHDYPEIVAELLEMLKHHDRVILDAELVTKTKTLAVFDIVNLGRHDLKDKTLSERKAILASLDIPDILMPGKHVHRNMHVVVHNSHEITMFYHNFVGSGHEGAMVKNPDSKYGATDSWLKLKKHDTLDCIVTGIEASSGGGYSLDISAYHKGQKVSLGRVGSFLKSVDPSQVQIGTVVEVQYQEITKELNLRHPFVIRIRDDKPPEQCTINVPFPTRKEEE